MDIEARVSRKEDTLLTFLYVLTGDLAGIRIPSPAAPGRADRLWEHTCFEAFVQVKGRPDYYEFNFSPSGEWAVHAFRGYRDGGPGNDDMLEPNITVRTKGKMLELNGVIRLDFLPTKQVGAALRLGLSAVIEEIDGRLSYWALEHPSKKPDFHHPDSFALEIPLPS